MCSNIWGPRFLIPRRWTVEGRLHSIGWDRERGTTTKPKSCLNHLTLKFVKLNRALRRIRLWRLSWIDHLIRLRCNVIPLKSVRTLEPFRWSDETKSWKGKFLSSIMMYELSRNSYLLCEPSSLLPHGPCSVHEWFFNKEDKIHWDIDRDWSRSSRWLSHNIMDGVSTRLLIYSIVKTFIDRVLEPSTG